MEQEKNRQKSEILVDSLSFVWCDGREIIAIIYDDVFFLFLFFAHRFSSTFLKGFTFDFHQSEGEIEAR